ncbi:MAG: adenylyl-sulfate kinase [Pseudomonadaceae bacterium]|nr:adenylyl-sulfate kinase [Pseudomonadaceae bacterium]
MPSSSLLNSSEVVWHCHQVTPEQREKNLGQKGQVFWFTGLSGAGKSTIANAFEAHLGSLGRATFLLDGDNVRHGLCRGLGMSEEDRRENVRRVGEVARLMADAGLIVICALISPYRADRDRVRQLMSSQRFVEVHVSTPLAVCEQRDPKGLYKKAREGVIKEFTGLDSPYEPPLEAELVVDSSVEPLAEIVRRLSGFVATS